jgi:hypothetical protein
MAIPTFPQKSGFEGEFNPETRTGEAALPETMHYKITCSDTGRVIQAETPLSFTATTVGGVVTEVTASVDFDGTKNLLCDGGSPRETHVVTVITDMDTPREVSDDFPFYVRRGGR